MPKYNPNAFRCYNSNPNLKAAGVSLGFTREQVEEYVKCTQDPIYFIEKYVRIVHVDHGLVNFKMYDFQKDLVRSYIDHRFTIAKIPRQSGKSTVTIAFILWCILFQPMQHIALLANKGGTAREILSKLQLAYEFIPTWMQQGIEEWNKGSVKLENGSRIVAGSTSSSAVRGNAYNLIFLDEFAFVPANVAEEFFTSTFPTISSGKTTKLIMISTPNGMNLFHKFWVDAKKKGQKEWNGYNPVEIHWSEVPGRDQAWMEQQLAVLGEEKFNQEFGCDFLGSANSLISGKFLSTMAWNDPITKHNSIDVYEAPKPGHLYIVSADTGRGEAQDYHAATVIDATEAPYRVVAKYRNNTLNSLVYPEILHNIGTTYNGAHILIETNDLGKQVADILHTDLEYENIFCTQNMGRAGQKLSGGFRKGSKLGVATSKPLKKIGCSNLKSLVESTKLIITDYNIIEELSTFVKIEDSYGAEKGMHDDLVMTLVLFSWMTTQPLFKELSNVDIRKKLADEQIAAESSPVLPFGVICPQQEVEVEVDNSGNVWHQAPHAVKSQSRFFQDIHYTMEEFDDDDYGGNTL